MYAPDRPPKTLAMKWLSLIDKAHVRIRLIERLKPFFISALARRTFSFLVKLLLAFAVFYYISWVSSEPLRYEWHRVTAELYRIMRTERGAIDLVAIGSSRSMRAFDGRYLAQLYESRLGRPVVILDMSKPYRGPAVQYFMLRDLLKYRKVKNFLVEYKLGSADDQAHRFMHMAAGFGDIVEDSWSHEAWSPWRRMQRIISLSLAKLTEPAVLGMTGRLQEVDIEGRRSRAAKTHDPTPPKTLTFSSELAEWIEDHGDWRNSTPRHWNFSDAQTWTDTHYVERIIDLARTHGVNVTFYHINRLFEPPLSDEMVSAFRRRFGARLLQLPVRELAKIYPDGYADTSHMNAAGSMVWMDWVNRRLSLNVE